ncbi:MAG: hypothetical protein K0S09_2909 [Sphingobacteriaceae bacterium]|jgi:asparagine synthase (glutamine-hydrolysing)|nr:hypothetical protein [Sphingobacteriaceae bacterium]
MCGINGIISRRPDREKALLQMNNNIIHRGPDDAGIYSDEIVGLAMRRLSIIDLNTGHQPMFNDNKSVVIVFNGEIYNYKILREQLEETGMSFSTNSDTEVIIKLYETYGTECFGMLDGMFAFSIYDSDANKVFIARDYFGEKPLHYISTEDGFYWASELKSIIGVLSFKPVISKKALNLYFQLTYIPAPYTIYEDVYKLKPNHYIEYDLFSRTHRSFEIQQNFKEIPKGLSFEEAKAVVHDKVRESVISRTVSDVPIGSFLSGGVDSSIVSLCVAQESSKPINTFSIGYKKKSFDESEKSRLVAKLIKSQHHEFIIDESDLSDQIDDIVLNFDEPFGDSSALASYLVARKTSARVKVALTGDGGDEVFGGYNKYYIGKLNSAYTKSINKGLHETIRRFTTKILATKDDSRGIRFKVSKLINSIRYEGDFYYYIISLGFQNTELGRFIKEEFFLPQVIDEYKIGLESHSIKDFRNIDRLLSLEGDMLVKVDRTSMLSSLECRAPFLNKDLWNFTNQLPDSYLMKGWNKKYILKKAFEEYFPKSFLDKSKKGFGVPVGDWLRTGLKKELLEYVDLAFLDKQGLFYPESVRQLVLNHVLGISDNTFKVWAYYCFQKWYKGIYDR